MDHQKRKVNHSSCAKDMGLRFTVNDGFTERDNMEEGGQATGSGHSICPSNRGNSIVNKTGGSKRNLLAEAEVPSSEIGNWGLKKTIEPGGMEGTKEEGRQDTEGVSAEELKRTEEFARAVRPGEEKGVALDRKLYPTGLKNVKNRGCKGRIIQ